jgi:hypothetical protein
MLFDDPRFCGVKAPVARSSGGRETRLEVGPEVSLAVNLSVKQYHQLQPEAMTSCGSERTFSLHDLSLWEMEGVKGDLGSILETAEE